MKMNKIVLTMHTARILALSIWNLTIVLYSGIFFFLKETIREAVMLSFKSETFSVRKSFNFENPFTWLGLFFFCYSFNTEEEKFFLKNIEHMFRQSGPIFP